MQRKYLLIPVFSILVSIIVAIILVIYFVLKNNSSLTAQEIADELNIFFKDNQNLKLTYYTDSTNKENMGPITFNDLFQITFSKNNINDTNNLVYYSDNELIINVVGLYSANGLYSPNRPFNFLLSYPLDFLKSANKKFCHNPIPDNPEKKDFSSKPILFSLKEILVSITKPTTSYYSISK